MKSDGSDHRLITDWSRFAGCGSTPPTSASKIPNDWGFLILFYILIRLKFRFEMQLISQQYLGFFE